MPANTEQRAVQLETGIDYELYLDCVHCGLCTASCPTYLELGTEMDGPRGRIYLMRAVADGKLAPDAAVKRHLDLCLDCRSCESACPSGVQYGKLIEPFRIALEKITASKNGFLNWVVLPLFPYARRLRLALAPARLMQRLGLDRFIERLGLPKLLPGPLERMYRMLPRLGKREPAFPDRLPAKGTRRATVALFTGCVGEAVFHSVNWATARVLQENGCDVIIPKSQTCCGAIHYHSGHEEPALQRAVANAAAFDPDSVDAVIVNIAGCGAMLKDYAHLHVAPEHAERVKKFAAKIYDVSEFLVKLGLVPPQGNVPLKATYHDACHLCHAQQIRSQPRRILASIPGLALVPLVESEICCGAAGTYNLVELEMAERLVERKVRNLAATGADIAVVANAGCTLHIGRRLREEGIPIRIVHPVEVLDWSYRGETDPTRL